MPGPTKKYPATIQLRLTADQLDDFAAHCRDHGLTVSEAIRAMIQATLDSKLSLSTMVHAQRHSRAA